MKGQSQGISSGHQISEFPLSHLPGCSYCHPQEGQLLNEASWGPGEHIVAIRDPRAALVTWSSCPLKAGDHYNLFS